MLAKLYYFQANIVNNFETAEKLYLVVDFSYNKDLGLFLILLFFPSKKSSIVIADLGSIGQNLQVQISNVSKC